MIAPAFQRAGTNMYGLMIRIAAAGVFYQIAVIEQIGPGRWVGASLAISVLNTVFGGGLFTWAGLQLLLFGVFWWYSVRHKARRGEQWAAQDAANRQAVDDRRRWADEQIKREREQRRRASA